MGSLGESTKWIKTSYLSAKPRQRVGYATQKPLELIKRIVSLSSDEGDIVADFYCGSGTTLVASKQLNRKYLGCDINITALNKVKERFF